MRISITILLFFVLNIHLIYSQNEKNICVEIKTLNSNPYIEIYDKISNKNYEKIGLKRNSMDDSLDFNTMKLTKIEFLNFDNFSFSKIDLSSNDIDSFPISLFSIKSLQSLDLVNNEFTEIPEGIASLEKLKSIEFGHTPLKKLPDDFTKLTNLKKLSINYHSIEDKILFFNMLAQLPNLQDLELWSVGIEDTLPEIFLQLKNVQRLFLLGSDFNFKYVYQYKELRDLEITLSILDSIGSDIKNLTNLERLKVVGSQNILGLPNEISCLKNLNTLIFDYGLGYTHHTIETKELYKTILSCVNLKNLLLGKYFEEFFPFWEHPNLEIFKFYGNSKVPPKADLKKIKKNIYIDIDYKCYEMNQINPKIICKDFFDFY